METPVETLHVETTIDNSAIDNTLTYKVAELNKIAKGIKDRNIEINKMRVEISAGKVESIYYFWPFLLASFILFFILSTHLQIALYAYSRYLPVIIAGHVFLLIHIFGGAFARKMRDRYNKRFDEKCASMYVQISKFQDELAELEIRKKRLLDELKDFDEAELLEI